MIFIIKTKDLEDEPLLLTRLDKYYIVNIIVVYFPQLPIAKPLVIFAKYHLLCARVEFFILQKHTHTHSPFSLTSFCVVASRCFMRIHLIITDS